MPTDVALKCSCGALQGVAAGITPHVGNHVVCMCDDCQTFAHWLGRGAEMLDKHGGTDIFQMPPAHIKITKGQEQLRCMRLSGKGLLRWYTNCCKTPVGNTMASPGIPFAGMPTGLMDPETRDAALGPVLASVMNKFAIGEPPPGSVSKVAPSLIFRTLKIMIAARLKRQHKPSPFFNPLTGKPVASPVVLPLAERDQLRKLCGPK